MSRQDMGVHHLGKMCFPCLMQRWMGVDVAVKCLRDLPGAHTSSRVGLSVSVSMRGRGKQIRPSGGLWF